MAFLRRLIARGPRADHPGTALTSPTTTPTDAPIDPFAAPAHDPFAPNPNDKYYSDDGKQHAFDAFKTTWSQWLSYGAKFRPGAIVHSVLRLLDVVVDDANGGGASILPVVNEGFVKTQFPRKMGMENATDDFLRIPVRKTVKDGLVLTRVWHF